MVEGREFPPVDVFFDGAVYWLADGYHRLMAAESLGLVFIDCTVHPGGLSDAIWFSCSANAAHGLRRTRDDVQLAIHRALKHPRSAGRSDRQIAEHVGCSHHTVDRVRQSLISVGQLAQQNERTGRDGKTYRADANRGRQPEPRELEQIDLEDALARAAPAPAAPALAMATAHEETKMIDFREQLVELLRPDDDGFDDPPREGLVKIFRPTGCWVYRIELGQEEEFRRWVADRFRLDELGAMEVTGEFPMLRVVSPLD